MAPEQLKDFIDVCHLKHNRNYRVLYSNMRMKDSVKGWIDAVVYAPMYDNEFQCFCREKESFLAEFEVVEEKSWQG